jgi:uncharacterized membrane protein YhaH (DUF805 family)
MNLFSFKGRVPRRDIWIVAAIQVVAVALSYEFLSWFDPVPLNPFIDVILGIPHGDPDVPFKALSVVVISATEIFIIWIGLATGIKRLHDLNKSGWWYLLSLVPYVGQMWIIVELGCFPSVEPNRFGASHDQIAEQT